MAADTPTDLKFEALEALRKALLDVQGSGGHMGGTAEFREGLVQDVLDAAWRHQFDDDPASFKRELKALLRGSVEEAP